ncbi:hypothetical protein [Haladaptatus cibarius]|uniref:hypothetical protein n=1 Tax=Haladaptatus cibarius TaxID=453847 RepID=UPI0011848BFA|nr:hypothetical protein [Haladaptatus cibarius]
MPFDENHSEPIVSPDTNNWTDFHYHELPRHEYQKRKKYRRLARYNTGIGHGDWSNQELLRHMENLHRFDAIAGQLKMDRSQKKRARKHYSSLDFRGLGRRVELVAFCVCVHVCNNDDRIFSDPYRRHGNGWKRYHPQQNDENNDPLFVNVAESIGLEEDDIQSMMSRLRHDLDDRLFQ